MKIALICCLVVLFTFSSTRLDAAETVCKFAQKNEYRVVNAGKSENVVVNACGPAVQVATPADVAAAKVDVETDFNQKLATSTQQLKADLDKGMNDAESRLKTSLTDAVNKLPQRLLSDAAKKEMEDSLRAEIKAEIDELRKDLQQQITDSKQPTSSKHPK